MAHTLMITTALSIAFMFFLSFSLANYSFDKSSKSFFASAMRCELSRIPASHLPEA